MSESLPTKPEHIARTNSRGLIEIVDINTGRVLCVQASSDDLLQDKWERLTRIDTPEGPVWIEKGLDLDLALKVKGIPYSRTVSDLLCEKVVNGQTLVGACKDMNLDYSLICRWRREHTEFREALDQAKKDRAEWLHDEMLDRARHARTSARTHIEALQWAAEKADPAAFAPKALEKGGMQGNITFVISTGIDRSLAGVEEVKDVTPKATAIDEDDVVIPEIASK
jgi:hypothetical protein